MDWHTIALYFGTVRNTLAVAPAESKVYGYTPLASTPRSAEAEETVQRRLKPFIDEQTQIEYLVPGVPALDIIPPDYEEAQQLSIALPSILQYALYKCDDPDKIVREIYAIQSGRRSALLCDESKGVLYRLKGCGDLYGGFPTRDAGKSAFPGAVEIRGCMFEQLSLRELRCAQKANEILSEIEPGINPLGWWEYRGSLTDYATFIKRTCALYEALGEKRLNDHLLYGIELLLKTGFVATSEEEVKANILNNRGVGEDNDWLWMTHNVLMVEGPEGLVQKDRVNLPVQTLPNAESLLTAVYPDCSLTLETLAEHLGEVLQRNIALFNEILPNLSEMENFSLLKMLYYRIGVEAGLILKKFHKAEFSWGTYSDSLAYHCNAHTNNFLILASTSQHEISLDPVVWTNMTFPRILGVCDFDMAFQREEFCSIGQNSNKTEQESWENVVETEQYAMRLTLSGDPEANSGVTNIVEFGSDEPGSAIKNALRDVVVVAYQNAYDWNEEGSLFDIALSQNMVLAQRYLINIALVLTSNVIA